MRKVKPLSERFWEKVDKSSPDKCWEWTGRKNNHGYGQISRGRRGDGDILSHRLSWEINIGPIITNICVLHKCDNPGCVNPDHLFLGTQGDNLKDCIVKGRANRRALVGENNAKAKLIASDVIAIRQKYAAGGVSYAELAADYRISPTQIGNLVRGDQWRHLDV